MTPMQRRILKLEQSRPIHDSAALELDLPPDLCLRIAEAKAAGSFPQSLATDDLKAILAAADEARGQA